MEYRNLGRSGVKVSSLCLGTMNFPYRTDEATSIALIHRALDAGINFVDTANFYGQALEGGKGQGRTEEVVGKALVGRRDRVVLLTKFSLPMDWDDPNARGGSRRHVIAACEASMRRLKTDYIDVYLMHYPDPDTPLDETLAALDALVRSGKVRYIGTSNFPAWRVMEGLGLSWRLGLSRFAVEQPDYNLLYRSIERELVPMAQAHGIGLLAYSPLAGGILTGKYHRGEPFPEGSRLVDPAWAGYAAGFMAERAYDVIEKLDELAAEKGCTISQLALAWVMRQPGITSAIIGPRTVEQYADNLKALELTLTGLDLERLDAVAPPARDLWK